MHFESGCEGNKDRQGDIVGGLLGGYLYTLFHLTQADSGSGCPREWSPLHEGAKKTQQARSERAEEEGDGMHEHGCLRQ